MTSNVLFFHVVRHFDTFLVWNCSTHICVGSTRLRVEDFGLGGSAQFSPAKDPCLVWVY